MVLLSAPSLPKIFSSRPHFPCYLQRFRSTAGQSSLVDDNVRPKYQNEETAISAFLYSKKTHPIYSSVSSTTNLLFFLSIPRRHITEVGCDQLRESCGTNMSHWGHQWWG